MSDPCTLTTAAEGSLPRSSAAPRRRAAGVLGLLALLALAVSVLAASPARADGPGVGAPWVASVGDSYISGEAGRWAGNTNGSASTVDALGPAAYFDNPARTAEQISRCHRSQAAEVFVGGGVNGVTLACSGARTSTFTNSDGDFKPGLDFYSDGSGRQGQARMLEAFARTHNVKLVPLSIGGNNFNFGDMVTQCIKNFLGSSSLFPDYCNDDASVKANLTAANVAAQTAAIRTAILNVRQAMRNAGYADGAYTILVQDYEAAIPRGSDLRYGQSGFTRQSTGGCGFWNADADWANTTALPAINGAVQSAAGQAGLSNVRLLELVRAFDGRQLCSKSVGLLEEQGLASWKAAGAADRTEWVDQIRIATAGTPYFQQESLHPNYWGQLALRNCIRQAYNGGSPRGGICTIAGPGLNAQGEPRMTLGRQLSPPTRSAGAGNPNGGTPADALCPSYAALTGVTLHMNGSAGSVTGACKPLLIAASSVSLGTAGSATPRIGTSGSRDVTAACPAQYVVTGFNGRSGLLIDALQLQCSKLNADGTLGSKAATVMVGGAGGSPFPEKSCSAGMAVGLYGRAGNDLDYLALECSSLS
jgi:hypothetical protein